MDTDDSDTNLYDSEYDSDDSSQDEICYVRDHKIVNKSMMLYVTWVSGRREWSDIENVQKDFPNVVKKYMEKHKIAYNNGENSKKKSNTRKVNHSKVKKSSAANAKKSKFLNSLFIHHFYTNIFYINYTHRKMYT